MRSAPAKNYRLLIEYDGTDFAGWQRQPGRRTVQGELERACRKLGGRPARIIGAGRTDAGVHAAGQVASVALTWKHPSDRLPPALNALMPADISVLEARVVPPSFSARKSALERCYRYAILNRPARPVLAKRYALWFRHPVDLRMFRRAAALFKGRHDFAAFCAARAHRAGTVRTINSIRVRATGGLITVDVAGRGFLHHMVRMMVGAILAAGGGKLPLSAIRRALRGSRSRVAQTAPARGLALIWVGYKGEKRPAVNWPPVPAINPPAAS